MHIKENDKTIQIKFEMIKFSEIENLKILISEKNLLTKIFMQNPKNKIGILIENELIIGLKFNIFYNISLDLLGSFIHLKYLYLNFVLDVQNTSVNNFLPDSLENLKKLIVFQIFQMNLEKIPDWITNLKDLRQFICTRSKLREIPNNFQNLENLVVVDLSENKLNILPEKFGLLKNLKYLDLAMNNLTYLPESFSELINLEDLHLAGNKLHDFPTKFSNLKLLRYLQLDDNNFDHFPSDFGTLENLKELGMSKNPWKINPNFQSTDLIKLEYIRFNLEYEAWIKIFETRPKFQTNIVEYKYHMRTSRYRIDN